LPNYDFQCAMHGVFEAMSRVAMAGVSSGASVDPWGLQRAINGQRCRCGKPAQAMCCVDCFGGWCGAMLCGQCSCLQHGGLGAKPIPSGVESVACPKCGEPAPVVWLRAPAMRKPGYEAIRYAGNDIPCESIEKALAEPEVDPDAGFWDDKDFGAEFVDALDRNTGRWHAGEWPPVELTPQEITTLKEGVAKG